MKQMELYNMYHVNHCMCIEVLCLQWHCKLTWDAGYNVTEVFSGEGAVSKKLPAS